MPTAPVEQGTIQKTLLFKGQVDQKKRNIIVLLKLALF